MLLTPKYCENIIVGVTYKRKFHWYVTDKLLWFLDYNKMYKALQDLYNQMGRSQKRFIYEVGDFNSFCEERWGIAVVNNSTAKDFLDKIGKYEVFSDELKNMFDSASDKSDYFPVLYVNFDKKELYSYFPEPESFEDFVPDDWKGIYQNFDNIILKSERYWIKNSNS